MNCVVIERYGNKVYESNGIILKETDAYIETSHRRNEADYPEGTRQKYPYTFVEIFTRHPKHGNGETVKNINS